MKERESQQSEGDDYSITRPDENALFRMQLALQSVEKRIANGDTGPALLDARDMLQSQVELLERIVTEEDEVQRDELEEEFRHLVSSTEEVRRRWRSSQEVH